MALTLNVNTNVAAINTQRHMTINNADLGKRLERLSSGLRVNGADDDAAGLSISEGFRAQLSGLTQGVRNTEMGANMVQVAEGSLNEVSAMLIRMRELAVQSANSTVNNTNREAIEAEFNQLKEEVDRIAHSTVYNDTTLLTGLGNQVDASSTALTTSNDTGVVGVSISGSPAGTYTFDDSAGDGTLTVGNGVISQTISISPLLDADSIATGSTAVANFERLGFRITLAGANLTGATGDYVDGDLDGKTIIVSQGSGASFQVGADNTSEDRIELSLGDMRATGAILNLGVVSMGTQSGARTAITQIDQAIDKVSNQRGNLGAILNRMRHTLNFTENSIEGNTASESTIRDADIATEVTKFTRIQILSQAGTAMLTQANTTPQSALTLLQ